MWSWHIVFRTQEANANAAACDESGSKKWGEGGPGPGLEETFWIVYLSCGETHSQSVSVYDTIGAVKCVLSSSLYWWIFDSQGGPWFAEILPLPLEWEAASRNKARQGKKLFQSQCHHLEHHWPTLIGGPKVMLVPGWLGLCHTHLGQVLVPATHGNGRECSQAKAAHRGYVARALA